MTDSEQESEPVARVSSTQQSSAKPIRSGTGFNRVRIKNVTLPTVNPSTLSWVACWVR